MVFIQPQLREMIIQILKNYDGWDLECQKEKCNKLQYFFYTHTDKEHDKLVKYFNKSDMFIPNDD